MKKYIIYTLFIACLVPAMGGRRFTDGPSFDKSGALSVSGSHGREWLFGYQQFEQWQKICFFRKNADYAKWEYEKFMRKQLFNQSFFPYDHSFGVERKMLDGLMYLKKLSPGIRTLLLLKLARRYLKSGMDKELLTVYYLLDRDSGPDKSGFIAKVDEISRLRDGGYLNGEVLKMDKLYGELRVLSAEEARQRAFNKYLNEFKRRGGRFYDDLRNKWIANWDRIEVLRALLKHKLIKKNNQASLVPLVSYMESIPDDLAKKIIEYFKLNTEQPEMYGPMLLMTGHNKLLDSALLKNFKYIKKNGFYPGAYDGFLLALNDKVKSWVLDYWFYYTYANVTGDYNKAYGLFQKIRDRSLDLKKYGVWRLPRVRTDSSLALLYGDSNLDDASAKFILHNYVFLNFEFYNKRDWNKKINVKFVKLLDPDNPKSINAAQLFPFASLSSEMKEKVFKQKIAEISPKATYPRRRSRYLEYVAGIKEPEYRRELLQFLFKQIMSTGVISLKCTGTAEQIAPFCLEDIMKTANGSDPKASILACQLIGSTGAYGKAVAPDLRKLLVSNNNFTVKIACMLALVEIGDRASVPVFERYLKDKNRVLARAAAQSIKMLKPVNESYEFFAKGGHK